jgi:hypothetical protein
MSRSLARNTRINNLPLELLSLIFITVVDLSLYTRAIRDESYGLTDYPTLLASVCAHWRRVAISIPKLWSYVDFTRDNSLQNLEHAKLYLGRSQNLPLRMRIGAFDAADRDYSGPFIDELPDNVDERVASLIRANASRLQSLVLNYTDTDFATDVLSILLSQGTEHSLQELALRRDSTVVYESQSLLAQDKLDQLLKPLHALYLEGLALDLSRVNCGDLVELHLVNPTNTLTVAQLSHILNSNPRLRAIKLSGLEFHTRASPNAQAIRLPSLRSLELRHVGEAFLNCLLQVVVPGPHELDLRLVCSSLSKLDEPTVRNTLVSFLRRASVKSLDFSGRWISLCPILTYLPHLQQLSLSVCDVKSGTFDGVEHAASTLVKLHTINLIECRLEDDSVLDPGLRVLLTLPSLRRIRHIGCGHFNNPRSQERFRRLISGDGINAQVSESPELRFEMHPSPSR